jgi:hypothetical protein
MKTNFLIAKALLLFAVCFAFSGRLSAQDSDAETIFNVSGDYGKNPGERDIIPYERNIVPQELLNMYNEAKERGNDNLKLALSSEIEKYLEKSVPQSGWMPEWSITREDVPQGQGEWYPDDVLIDSSDVGSGSFRQLDMKEGEDGRMYLAINRRNVSGVNGAIRVYISSNGGGTWPSRWSITYSGYIHSISMLVEKRSVSSNDSMKILVYFIGSPNSNYDDASLWLAYINDNGAPGFLRQVAAPSAGNKLQYISACSDGQYFSTGTYMHAVVQELTNAGAHVRLRHLRSIDWGETHTTASITTGNSDFYPSAAYCEKNGNDSIYIAIERRLSGTDYEIRVLTTPEVPASNYHPYYITSGANVKYERPCITVAQQHYLTPRRILVTCTKDNIARYHSSVNGGSSWTVDSQLGPSTSRADYTWCNSDSLSSAGNNFVACYVDLNGDSVNVRQGVIGNLGTTFYERNSEPSSGIVAPVCAVLTRTNIITSLYASFAYAGLGPVKTFFNAEQLNVGITQNGNTIPEKYSLAQNYPNPFNPFTSIKFNIPQRSAVRLEVYDITGKQVAVLVNRNLNAGEYTADFNAAGLSSGAYFYKLRAGDYKETKKMLLLK